MQGERTNGPRVLMRALHKHDVEIALVLLECLVDAINHVVSGASSQHLYTLLPAIVKVCVTRGSHVYFPESI